MGVNVAVAPLEKNFGYISREAFDYTLFSGWFNNLKVQFNNLNKPYGLTSDRLEAIHEKVSSFLSVGLADKGYEYSSKVSVVIIGDNSCNRSTRVVELPERGDNETTEALTERWLNSVTDEINVVSSTLKLGITVIKYLPLGSASVTFYPPELFPP